MTRVSIGKDAAIALAATRWWEGLDARAIAERQLFTEELCCPFPVFHEAVESSLGRPVYTHEFALDYAGICREFLGEKQPPTIDEIIELIPEDKRLFVVNR